MSKEYSCVRYNLYGRSGLHAGLKMAEADYIIDEAQLHHPVRGDQQLWNIIKHTGAEYVVYAGVHLNL